MMWRSWQRDTAGQNRPGSAWTVLLFATVLIVSMSGRAGAAESSAAQDGGAAAPVAGPAQAECLAAYTEAQRLRKAGQLSAAYQKLLICSQDSCPAVVKRDCVPWLTDTERALPSIVVVAKGIDGKDAADVRVYVDDVQVATQLDGRPIIVDPGPHKLRFEHRSAEPIEQTVVVQVGVKDRRLDVSFAPEPSPVPASGREGGVVAAPSERGEPIVGYVLTGVGAVALGSFAVFGLMGQGEADEYDETCAPTKTCDPDDVSATETKLLVADISLIVGIAAVGVGVGLILYNKLSDPEPTAARVRIDLRPTLGGAIGSLSAAF